jgi:hypothetical protein
MNAGAVNESFRSAAHHFSRRCRLPLAFNRLRADNNSACRRQRFPAIFPNVSGDVAELFK